MKLIRNNFCVVSASDLFRKPIPKFPDGLPDCLTIGDFVVFRSKEAINYFKGREDILDYDKVSCLSEKELDRSIKKIKIAEKVYTFVLKGLALSRRKGLNEYEKQLNKLEILKAKRDSLIEYKAKKEKIDFHMQQSELIMPKERPMLLQKTNQKKD